MRKKKKVVIKAEGIGWTASCPAYETNQYFIIPKKKFMEFMEIISETHDMISGGFIISITPSE